MKLFPQLSFQLCVPRCVPSLAVIQASLLFAGGLPPSTGLSKEPQWREPWQQQLVAWIKELTPADVAIEEKAFDFSKLDPAEMRRNWYLANSNGPNLPFANAALKLPAESFLWPAIWRPELPLEQSALKPHQLSAGQIWSPTHPSIACLLGWLHGWDRPWNPYFHDPRVANRAAVISILTLVMIREQIHYDNAGEAGCRQPPAGPPHTGSQGFSLTFNAYTYSQVAQALPEDVRKAWGDGLRWFATLLGNTRPSGPENMRLSTPVGISYTGLALQDESFKQLAETAMDKLLESEYSQAGYIRDGGVPDGSYNGISLHRLAEYWAISQSPRILDVIRRSYELKNYLVLPEPSGGTLSPSHFNARCADGFDSDQYQGREVMLLPQLPEAAWFARKHWPQDLTSDAVSKLVERNLNRFDDRVPGAGPWGIGKGTESRPHGWGRVLALPYLLYHSGEPDKVDLLIEQNDSPVILKENSYTKSFGGEFYVVRRPGYAAVFYTGPAVPSDNGATNYRAMLEDEGGYMMGFGGGGLSAFWTPEAGSLLLGRMTGMEGYQRRKKLVGKTTYVIGGWRDWLVNQIVGETKDGKILTSSRVANPRSRLVNDGSRLEIKGEIPGTLRRQGEITKAKVSYNRSYEFQDDGIVCHLEVSSSLPLEMKSLYETLPLVLSTGRTEKGPLDLRFLDANGETIAEVDGRVPGVRTLEMRRHNGSARIEFPMPITISLASEAALSRQVSFVRGKTLLVELPVSLVPGTPLQLSYHLRIDPVPPLSPQDTSTLK